VSYLLSENRSGECKEEFEDFLQAASEGHGSSGGEIWKMRTKWGHDLKVLLLASMCTDSGGVMSGGTMCVIMPFMMPGLHLDCNIPPLDDVQDIDTEGNSTSYLWYGTSCLLDDLLIFPFLI
jgi:hypothetical protein